jgi:hypothetical protein
MAELAKWALERYRDVDTLKLMNIIDNTIEYALETHVVDVCDFEEAYFAIKVLKERMKETHP